MEEMKTQTHFQSKKSSGREVYSQKEEGQGVREI
jgi:hypothetical protein